MFPLMWAVCEAHWKAVYLFVIMVIALGRTTVLVLDEVIQYGHGSPLVEDPMVKLIVARG